MRPDPLDHHRARETPAAAMLAIGDSGLTTLLAVWPLVKIKVAEGETPLDWESLWSEERVSVDVRHASTLLGCDLNAASRILERAIELRLVYPDGTIHSMVEGLLSRKLELWKRQALGLKAEIPDGVPADDDDGGPRPPSAHS